MPPPGQLACWPNAAPLAPDSAWPARGFRLGVRYRKAGNAGRAPIRPDKTPYENLVDNLARWDDLPGRDRSLP